MVAPTSGALGREKCIGKSFGEWISFFFSVSFLCLSLFVKNVSSHGDDECEYAPGYLVVSAPYVPGTLTVDGNSSDWARVNAHELDLRGAVYHDDYEAGKLMLKVAHDGTNIYFLAEFPGVYTYNATSEHLCPSMAIMFQIGDRAEYHEMGNCPNIAGVCTADNCRGFEVDLMHFEISTAVPGRLYGANLADTLMFSGDDRYGHLKDLYAFNAHCINLDGPVEKEGFNSSSPDWGAGGSQNDWRGAWGHTSMAASGLMSVGMTPSNTPYGTIGAGGNYIFEFTRPLRTPDRLQQDAQLTIGLPHMFGVAMWYPTNGTEPWRGVRHYVGSCNWIRLDLIPAAAPAHGWGSSNKEGGMSESVAAAMSSLAILIAISAIFVSIVVGWWVRNNALQFTRVDAGI